VRSDFANNQVQHFEAAQIVEAAINAWRDIGFGKPEATYPKPSGATHPEERVWHVASSKENVTTGCAAFALPRQSLNCFTEWLGRRIIWWPCKPMLLKRMAIVSSRIGKRRDLHRWWFDALRTAVIRTDSENECVCVVEGTMPAETVSRACELFGVSLLNLYVPDQTVNTADELVAWLRKMSSGFQTENSVGSYAHAVYLSPELVAESVEQRRSTSGEVGIESDIINSDRIKLPIGDIALAGAGERIVAISCRPKGNVERLLTRRLSEQHDDGAIVLISCTDDGPPVPESLKNIGAVPWFLQNIAEPNSSSQSANDRADFASGGCTIDDGPLNCPDEWLYHWTRPVAGPWHDQSKDEYLDELILGCDTADRSAIAALMRLMSQQVIKSSVSEKNKPASVSFTAVPLQEFRRRRVFRGHRQRFDFEPWGIAIRKTALQKLGAEAVVYIDGERDKSNTEPKFRQPQFDTKKRIDWSEEREWRIEGDLNLNVFPVDDITLFVDRENEANILRKDARWPVLVVP
jgi:hypothetical protein